MFSIEKNNVYSSNELYFKLYDDSKNNLNSQNSVVKTDNNEWYLEIPKIELKANIHEGTSQEILNEYIGHFEGTGIVSGNICLAAHNRGYDKNYFSELHKLEINDEIKYYYKEEVVIFKVLEKFIIEETNIQVLENYNKDELTLITCVENKPNLRRCIKAIKK